MARLDFYWYLITEINGQVIELGSLQTPEQMSVDGIGFRRFVQIAASGTATLLDISSDLLSEFDFLLIASDRDLQLELTADAGGEVGTVVSTVPVKGSGTEGEYGIPFLLGDDEAYANYSSEFAGGTLDAIEKIVAENQDSSNAANVIILAMT